MIKSDLNGIEITNIPIIPIMRIRIKSDLNGIEIVIGFANNAVAIAIKSDLNWIEIHEEQIQGQSRKID